MSTAPLAPVQARVRLLPRHRGRVHGDLVRRRAAARAEPEGAAARQPRRTRRRRPGRRSSCRRRRQAAGAAASSPTGSARAEDATDARADGPGLAAPADQGRATRASTRSTRARRSRCRSTRRSRGVPLRTKHVQRGYGTFHDEEIGHGRPAASGRPAGAPRVAFYSRGFEDVQATVAFVRDRVLVATAVALLIALIGGLPGRARGSAAACGRLERAARDVARGPLRGAAARDLEGRARPAHRRPSTRCSSSSRAWTSRARSSSPPRRTSCARRSSRWAASSSCSRTRTSTRRPAREFLETMGEQVERLQKLSVDLLDLSRLDSGSVELHTEPVDLAELARSVAGEFHPRARRARHRPRCCDVPEEGPSALCDRERVAQIMRILLDNALRHTPGGHGRDRERSPLQRRRRAHGGRQRPRPAGRRARQGLRALLHRRRGARRRARPRDRPRARGAHGRRDWCSRPSATCTAFTLELPDGADGNGA